MKNGYWKIIIIGIILIGIISCQTENPIEEIEFPDNEFTIKSNSDTTLFGEQGTRIFIGTETFQYPNGESVKGSIRIQLKEFYTKSDIILSELSTLSYGKILETGGMVNIKGFANNKEIEIRPDKRIAIHFPKTKEDYRKMNLFYGNSGSTETNVENWAIDTTNLIKSSMRLGMYGYKNFSYDDSTPFSYIPQNFPDTGYYWSPISLYVNQFEWSETTMDEINKSSGYASVNFILSTGGKVTQPTIEEEYSNRTKNEIIKFMAGLPNFNPAKNKSGQPSKLEGSIWLYVNDMTPIYKSDKEYIKSFNAKYLKYENQPIRNIDEAELNYYIFSVSKLGWINCDRFIEFEEKVDLIVNETVSLKTKLKLIFRKIDGVIKPKVIENKFVFPQVPKGQKATIFGMKHENGKLLAAFEEVTLGEKPINNLNFSEISLDELRKKLNEI